MILRNKKILGVIILIALIAWLVHYGIENYETFSSLTIENPLLLIPIAIIFLLSYIPISAITYYLLLPLGIKLGKKESFALSIVTGFYNLITPFRGGMAARAVYLKKRYNFTYTNFLATLAASYIIMFFVSAVLGLIALFGIYSISGTLNYFMLTLFSGMFLILGLVMLFSPKIPEVKYNFVNRFIKVLNGWSLINKNKSAIIIISIASTLQILLGALSTYLQFMIFGVDIGLYGAIFLSCVGSLSLLISITPAGLGINEAILIFSASTLGITPLVSLSSALVGRFVSIVIMFILGPIFSYNLLRKNNGRH